MQAVKDKIRIPEARLLLFFFQRATLAQVPSSSKQSEIPTLAGRDLNGFSQKIVGDAAIAPLGGKSFLVETGAKTEVTELTAELEWRFSGTGPLTSSDGKLSTGLVKTPPESCGSRGKLCSHGRALRNRLYIRKETTQIDCLGCPRLRGCKKRRVY